ncbi:hypothetical protein C8R46DRAFT_1056140 [Mycena filopes]|nr:hypothetical protein C8R46DRAFT_1056140 [Mycena filopes]
MLLLTTTLSLLLLTPSIAALPTRRGGTSGGTLIMDALGTLYDTYLQTQGVTDGSFYMLFGGEREIDYAGTADDESMFETNHILFETADSLPHMDNFNSTGDLMFSVQYGHFISALRNISTPLSKDQTDKMDNLTAAMRHACIDVLDKVTNDAFSAYRQGNGTGNTTDPGFTEFAAQMYGGYQEAIENCHEASNAVENYKAQLQGDDNALIGNAIQAMNPILDGDEQLYPGLNMQISGAVASGGPTGTFKGGFVPAYLMPSLNSTITIWQTTPDAPATLTWNSTMTTSVDVDKGESTTATVKYLWNKASESQSSNMSFEATTTSFTSVSFGGMELIDVERGAWFDDFLTASAVGNPPTTDPHAAEHKAAFDKYFGTAEKPGPAAVYNDKALVVYKPSATFKYATQSDYNAAKAAQASLSGGFGLFSGSASGKGSSNDTSTDDETMTISFTPNSKNAYLVGFVMRSYWDNASGSIVNTSSSA